MGTFTNFTAGMNDSTIPGVHPEAVLVNVLQYAGTESQIRQTRKLFDKIHPQRIMLDSGGYQLLSSELKGAEASYDCSKPMLYSKERVNLAPAHIFEAVLKLDPDICTSLDLPVLKVKDANAQNVEFMRKLGFNLVWMRESALLHRKHCPEVELFIPLQFFTIDQFIEYIEKPLMELDYDGISLPTRNAGPAEISLFLLRFNQIGVNKIHLLSVANFFELALAAYFARHMFEWVSVDATTWRKASDLQKYIDPNTLCAINVGESSIFQNGDHPYCSCPWCQGQTFTNIKNMPMADRTSFLRCHNYFVIQKAGRDFYEHSNDLLTLERFLILKNPTRIERIKVLIEVLSIATHMRNTNIKALEHLLIKK